MQKKLKERCAITCVGKAGPSGHDLLADQPISCYIGYAFHFSTAIYLSRRSSSFLPGKYALLALGNRTPLAFSRCIASALIAVS